MPRVKLPTPAEIDQHVGAAIRVRRRARGMSQQALADAIDVSFQQVQKYERGSNRVSASMMYLIAAALQTTPADLFEGLPNAGGETDGGGLGPLAAQFFAAEGALDLARVYAKLPDQFRRALVAAARAFAGEV